VSCAVEEACAKALLAKAKAKANFNAKPDHAREL
jgi:hypothetical protein